MVNHESSFLLIEAGFIGIGAEFKRAFVTRSQFGVLIFSLMLVVDVCWHFNQGLLKFAPCTFTGVNNGLE